jgi:hypothetical protein
LYAQRLYGQILAGQNLQITNPAGSVVINENGLTVTNMTLTLTRDGNRSRVKLDALEGFRIQGSSNGVDWTNRLSADTNGNLTLTGALTTGTGASSVRIDTNGLYIGGSSFSTAPVRITPSGNATFSGTVTASNVSLTGGNMGWGNFRVDEDGTLHATNAVISGNVTANRLIGNISIESPTIHGGVITGTKITSDTEINVGTNVFVGNRIVLTGSGDKSIVFYGSGNITFKENSGVTIAANTFIDFSCITVTHRGSQIATQEWVTNNFVHK